MLWIGLTGSIGSGKSTVARLIKSLGFPVVDADKISHEVLHKGSETYFKIIQHFGPDILSSSGDIDRGQLGKIVFSDQSKMIVLESIIHPEVQKKVLFLKNKYKEEGFSAAFYDVPLLFEKQLQKQFDQIWCVNIDEKQQFERLKNRNGWSIEEINRRLSYQIPLNEKIKSSTVVINNSGSLEELEMQIKSLLKNIKN